MLYKTIILLIFYFVAITATAQIETYDPFLTNNKQVIFVQTNSPEAITGMLSLYERKNTISPWKLYASFPITVGRSGLAWDAASALPHQNMVAAKQEGDGKSPAGVFAIGPVFSYHKMNKIKMPFVQVDTNDICVDDMNSAYYNRLTQKDTVIQKDWNSFEYMQRRDDFYEYGVWVQYNSTMYEKGKGSCIFLHVWLNDAAPTSGCTAMSKENILKLIHWIDESKNPVLLQVVKDE